MKVYGPKDIHYLGHDKRRYMRQIMAAEFITVGDNKFKYKGEGWSTTFCGQSYAIQRKHQPDTSLYSISRFFCGMIIEEQAVDITWEESEELLKIYMRPTREDKALDEIIQKVEVTKMMKVL